MVRKGDLLFLYPIEAKAYGRSWSVEIKHILEFIMKLLTFGLKKRLSRFMNGNEGNFSLPSFVNR